MTRDMYGYGVNVNLMAGTKLNIFKELEDQIEPKNNKGTKMNQINNLKNVHVLNQYHVMCQD